MDLDGGLGDAAMRPQEQRAHLCMHDLDPASPKTQ